MPRNIQDFKWNTSDYIVLTPAKHAGRPTRLHKSFQEINDFIEQISARRRAGHFIAGKSISNRLERRFTPKAIEKLPPALRAPLVAAIEAPKPVRGSRSVKIDIDIIARLARALATSAASIA